MTKGDLIEGLMAIQKPAAEPRNQRIRREIIENMLADQDGQVHSEKDLVRVHGDLMASGDCWVILSQGETAPKRIVVLDAHTKTAVWHDLKQ